MSSNGASEEKRAKLDVKPAPAGHVSKTANMDEKTFQAAVEDIDNCQSEIDNLNEQAAEEILAVEVKYNELRKPHYAKRAEIIAKVPEFWCTAFLNHPQLTNLFTDDEQQVLQFLKNFFVEEFDDIKNGFKIILKFESNPYFENETIVKEFHLGTEQPRQVVTPIKWKPGKNFLSSTVPEKESRKRKAPDSFFSWFTSSEPSSSDIISEWLKDELWTNPLQFFMMPSVEEEDDDEDDEEVEDAEDDEDEEEEEAEPDDSEDGSAEEACEN